MRYLKLLFALSLACTLLHSSGVAEELQLAGIELPGLLEAKGTGPYNKLFEAVVADSGVAVTLNIRPLARAFREYNTGKYAGIFPATTDIVEPASIESVPVNRVKVFLYTAPNTKPIRSIQSLSGKRVGLVRGMDYPEKVTTAPVKFDYATDETTNIKKLLGKRIDAFFGTVPDVYLALEAMGGTIDLSVDTSVYYMNNRDCFVFLDKSGYRSIMKKLNKSIQKLTANGTVKKILGNAFVE